MVQCHARPLPLAYGRDVLFCLRRYNCSFDGLLSSHSLNDIVRPPVLANCTEAECTMASLLLKCMSVRYDLL